MRFNNDKLAFVLLSLFLLFIGCQSRRIVERLDGSDKKEARCLSLGIIDESEHALFVFTNEQLGLPLDCDVFSSSCDCISIEKKSSVNFSGVASSVIVIRHVSPRSFALNNEPRELLVRCQGKSSDGTIKPFLLNFWLLGNEAFERAIGELNTLP
jgi:hypothetical protein